MDVFLARQPIFDRNMNVYAYELLFRSGGGNNFYDAADQEQASTEVLTSGFFSMDIAQVASGKRVFDRVDTNKDGIVDARDPAPPPTTALSPPAATTPASSATR